MELLAWRWLPLFALVSCLLPTSGHAAPDAAGTATQAEARAWLARMQSAANAGNYQGTMVFMVGGTLSSTRVSHYAVGDQIYEQLEAMDGRKQRVLRHNDMVHTLWVQSRVAVIEKRETLAAWSTTPQAIDPSALEQYAFKREGVGRVAGRDVVIVLLEPRDGLRYAQRLWADQATGLMLRADVMAFATQQAGQPVGSQAGQQAGQQAAQQAGQQAAQQAQTPQAPQQPSPGMQRMVLESTAFSEVLINVRPQPDVVLQEIRALHKLEGWRVMRPQQQRTTLDAEGWTLAKPVPGFSFTGCVKRGMDTAEAADAQSPQPVLQAVFTDGVSHVSLFAEPFKPQRHRGEMQAQQGATATLMTRRGEHWLTVVGDVPVSTLKLFADALERRRP